MTQFVLDEDQLRKTDRLRIEYQYLLIENETLWDLKEFCDSVNTLNEARIFQKNVQIHSLMRTNSACQTAREQERIKYELVDEELKKRNKRVRIYQITTIAGLLGIILVAL